MSIESNLKSIAESLATIAKSCLITAATGTPAKAPDKEPEKAPEKAPKAPVAGDSEPEVTVDDVREALSDLVKAEGAAKAKRILEKHGAPSVTALDSKHYASVLAEFKATTGESGLA